MISCRTQVKAATKARIAGSVEWTLKTFADPIRRKLKVRSGLKAAGIDVGNHSRNGLVVAS